MLRIECENHDDNNMKLPLFKLNAIEPDGIYSSINNILCDFYEYESSCSPTASDLNRKIQDQIMTSTILDDWSRVTESHVKRPNFKDYLHNYKKVKYDDLQSEVKKFGIKLSPGQILFRGMRSDEITSTWERPFSTSLSPYIACYHARKHITNSNSDPKVTLMAYIISNHRDTCCLVGRLGEDKGKLGQEYEVLISAGTKPIVTHTYQHNGFEVSIFE